MPVLLQAISNPHAVASAALMLARITEGYGDDYGWSNWLCDGFWFHLYRWRCGSGLCLHVPDGVALMQVSCAYGRLQVRANTLEVTEHQIILKEKGSLVAAFPRESVTLVTKHGEEIYNHKDQGYV